MYNKEIIDIYIGYTPNCSFPKSNRVIVKSKVKSEKIFRLVSHCKLSEFCKFLNFEISRVYFDSHNKS